MWPWAGVGLALGLAGVLLAFLPEIVGLALLGGSMLERRRSPSFGARLLPLGVGLVSAVPVLLALTALSRFR